MKKVFFLFCLLSSTALLGQRPDKKNLPQEIDVVFCADLSASTNGLIRDIKESFWVLINHHKTLTQAPILRIAVVFYGRPSFGSKNNYVKVLSDLSTNYDSIFQKIDELNPNIEKGDQFVGAALDKAINQISWSKDKNTLKIIYLIGNGSVQNGASNIKTVCKLSKAKGIVIQSIYCSSKLTEKEIKGWENIANLTDGKSATIFVNKQQQSDANINAANLSELNISLNRSFIYYGNIGFIEFNSMKKVDSIAIHASSTAFASRVLYKIMLNANDLKFWDLISYSCMPDFNLYQVDRNTLPNEYSTTLGSEMLSIIANKKNERALKTLEVKELLKNDYSNLISNRVLKEDIGDDGLLDRVLVKSYMKMASAKGFTW